MNPISGKKDINVFVVYKLNSISSGSIWLKGGYDKFACFANPTTRELIIGGDSGDFIVIGSISAFKTKANAGDLNKWICLSIHWDMHSSPATNKSSVYCNGKKLASFTAKTSSGDSQITLGDIKKTGVNDSPLDG